MEKLKKIYGIFAVRIVIWFLIFFVALVVSDYFGHKLKGTLDDYAWKALIALGAGFLMAVPAGRMALRRDKKKDES